MPRGGRREGAGRPVGSRSRANVDLREAAQTFTRSAVATLASIMRDKEQPAAARVSAANAILDRAHGKPKQEHQHSGPNGGPIQHVDLSGVSDEELARLEAILGPLVGVGEGGEGEKGDRG